MPQSPSYDFSIFSLRICWLSLLKYWPRTKTQAMLWRFLFFTQLNFWKDISSCSLRNGTLCLCNVKVLCISEYLSFIYFAEHPRVLFSFWLAHFLDGTCVDMNVILEYWVVCLCFCGFVMSSYVSGAPLSDAYYHGNKSRQPSFHGKV